MAASGYFSLALRTDGTVWAWGDNRAGQLGRGMTSNHEVTPARVPGLAGVIKISAGSDFSLALCSDGTVSAWGDNRRGQLGNSTTAGSPMPVKVTGLSHVTGISAGYDSSMATRTNGISAITSVWTWGGNDFGQLGDGTLTSHSTPERVTGLPLYIAASPPAADSPRAWATAEPPPPAGSPRSWAPTARYGPGATTAPASWAALDPALR